MISIRRSQERGRASFGWLNSRHTFSFGQYYDPAHMGVSALRVINDDSVTPGAGFGTHGHSDMEIISLVTQGEMVHKDSEGHEQVLPAGEFQLMSAGSGIMHSEYNASSTEPLHFLQIWIQPNQRGGSPGYQQKAFDLSEAITPVITPDGRDGTLMIKQDATVNHVNLSAGQTVSAELNEARTYYVHVIEGQLSIDGQALNAGDGATLEQLIQATLSNAEETITKAILFDLP